MYRTKSLVAPLRTGLGLLLGLYICSLPLLAMAQYVPPKRGLPGRRAGAGTRGTCLIGQKSLMPVVPKDGFGMTTTARPTFFWYVPSSTLQAAEFVILDDEDQELYRTMVPLTSSGLVSYTPPANALSTLQSDKDYRWQFSLVCDADHPSKNPFVEGVFQVVKPSNELTNVIQRAMPSDRPQLYAQAGIWFDSLTTLATLRCTRPQDVSLADRWSRLLTSVELSDLAKEPISQYCNQVANGQANRAVVEAVQFRPGFFRLPLPSVRPLPNVRPLPSVRPLPQPLPQISPRVLPGAGTR